jgi:hypothetical protein
MDGMEAWLAGGRRWHDFLCGVLLHRHCFFFGRITG